MIQGHYKDNIRYNIHPSPNCNVHNSFPVSLFCPTDADHQPHNRRECHIIYDSHQPPRRAPLSLQYSYRTYIQAAYYSMNPRLLRNCSHSKNRMYIPFYGKHQDTPMNMRPSLRVRNPWKRGLLYQR